MHPWRRPAPVPGFIEASVGRAPPRRIALDQPAVKLEVEQSSASPPGPYARRGREEECWAGWAAPGAATRQGLGRRSPHRRGPSRHGLAGGWTQTLLFAGALLVEGVG